MYPGALETALDLRYGFELINALQASTQSFETYAAEQGPALFIFQPETVFPIAVRKDLNSAHALLQ